MGPEFKVSLKSTNDEENIESLSWSCLRTPSDTRNHTRENQLCIEEPEVQGLENFSAQSIAPPLSFLPIHHSPIFFSHVELREGCLWVVWKLLWSSFL